MEALDHDTKIHMLKEIGIFALKLVNGISQVHVERDSDNNVALKLAPSVMPSEFVMMRSNRFNKLVLDPYRPHVSKFWTVEQIDQIERDHKDLLKAFIEESATKALIEKHDVKTIFMRWPWVRICEHNIGGVRLQRSQMGGQLLSIND
jgi:hypothetical protein